MMSSIGNTQGESVVPTRHDFLGERIGKPCGVFQDLSPRVAWPVQTVRARQAFFRFARNGLHTFGPLLASHVSRMGTAAHSTMRRGEPARAGADGLLGPAVSDKHGL